jgi:hypothetical protein
MPHTTHIRTIPAVGSTAQGIGSLCAGTPGFALTASVQAGDVTTQ